MFKTKRIIAAAALLVVCVQNAWAWTAEDANEGWTFPVPGRWIGGSYHQITERVNAAQQAGEGNALHVQILRGLAADARYLDAILLHLESSADGSKGDGSFLKIRTTPAGSDAFPPITSLTNETWVKYGGRLLSSIPYAVDVQLIRHQEDIVIRGNQVATAGFKIVMGAERDRYRGLVVIYRKSGVMTFNLDAPWQVGGLRLEEMWKMVRSIQFKE